MPQDPTAVAVSDKNFAIADRDTERLGEFVFDRELGGYTPDLKNWAAFRAT